MELNKIIEAVLFSATKPLSADDLTKILRKGFQNPESTEQEETAAHTVKEKDVQDALDKLEEDLKEHSIILQQVAGGYRLATHPQYVNWIKILHDDFKPSRLSQPSLETLAVIAYRQPVSRSEIESIRGVGVGGLVDTLVEKGVVRVAGRSELPGRPLLYETTELFLQHFGLKGLEELPNLTELKRVVIPEAPPAPNETQQELIEEVKSDEAQTVQQEN